MGSRPVQVEDLLLISTKIPASSDEDAGINVSINKKAASVVARTKASRNDRAPINLSVPFFSKATSERLPSPNDGVPKETLEGHNGTESPTETAPKRLIINWPKGLSVERLSSLLSLAAPPPPTPPLDTDRLFTTSSTSSAQRHRAPSREAAISGTKEEAKPSPSLALRTRAPSAPSARLYPPPVPKPKSSNIADRDVVLANERELQRKFTPSERLYHPPKDMSRTPRQKLEKWLKEEREAPTKPLEERIGKLKPYSISPRLYSVSEPHVPVALKSSKPLALRIKDFTLNSRLYRPKTTTRSPQRLSFASHRASAGSVSSSYNQSAVQRYQPLQRPATAAALRRTSVGGSKQYPSSPVSSPPSVFETSRTMQAAETAPPEARVVRFSFAGSPDSDLPTQSHPKNSSDDAENYDDDYDDESFDEETETQPKKRLERDESSSYSEEEPSAESSLDFKNKQAVVKTQLHYLAGSTAANDINTATTISSNSSKGESKVNETLAAPPLAEEAALRKKLKKEQKKKAKKELKRAAKKAAKKETTDARKAQRKRERQEADEEAMRLTSNFNLAQRSGNDREFLRSGLIARNEKDYVEPSSPDEHFSNMAEKRYVFSDEEEPGEQIWTVDDTNMGRAGGTNHMSSHKSLSRNSSVYSDDM